jgi:hypothetical protein
MISGKRGKRSVAERRRGDAVLPPVPTRADRAAYRDVKPGDRYALTYIPGSGTELSFNGSPLVVIDGADFAAAYFSIWLGKRPLDPGLKDKLLRKREGSA